MTQLFTLVCRTDLIWKFFFFKLVIQSRGKISLIAHVTVPIYVVFPLSPLLLCVFFHMFSSTLEMPAGRTAVNTSDFPLFWLGFGGKHWNLELLRPSQMIGPSQINTVCETVRIQTVTSSYCMCMQSYDLCIKHLYTDPSDLSSQGADLCVYTQQVCQAVRMSSVHRSCHMHADNPDVLLCSYVHLWMLKAPPLETLMLVKRPFAFPKPGQKLASVSLR